MQGEGGLLIKVSNLKKLGEIKIEIELQSHKNSCLSTHFPRVPTLLQRVHIQGNLDYLAKGGGYPKLTHNRAS